MAQCPYGCGWKGEYPDRNHDDPNPKRKRLNPFKCPGCLGGGEDFGLYDFAKTSSTAPKKRGNRK